MKKVTAIWLTLLFCLSFLTSCDKADTKIGYVGGLTGTNSELGVSGMYGALLAVEDINHAGGVNGRKLELVTRDDRNDKEAAVKADQALHEEGCIAIIGHMTSDMAELTVPYINKNKILMISPTIAIASLSNIDDYFFRLIPSTKYQAERIGESIKAQKLKKVQIIYSDQNVTFAESINSFLLGDLEQGAVKTQMLGVIAAGDKGNDYRELIRSITTSDADALVIIASADIVSEVAQSLYQSGCHKKVFLPAWSMTNDLIKRGGPAVEGYYGVNFVDYDSKLQTYLTFKDRYVKKYGDDPTFASIMSYESVTVLAGAMKKAASYDADDLKAAILSIKRFPGLQGTIELDRFGDCDERIYLYQIKNGKFVKAEANHEI